MAVSAIVASTVVGLAGTVYTQDQQKSAQAKARKAQDEAEEEARANEKKIRDNSAEVKTAASSSFGIDDGDGVGSYNDFLTPIETVNKPKSGLSTPAAGTSGLGV